MKVLQPVLIAAALAAATAPARADDDSSASAAAGFGRVVAASEGVVVKVRVDRAGRELAESAVMRVVPDQGTRADLAGAFARGVDASTAPQVSQADVDADSSTCGWIGGWRFARGWYPPYYYQSYQPAYYGGAGDRYPYQYAQQRTYYDRNDPDFGNRYYYYRRQW